MALNQSKSVTAHKNSINRTVKYVCKLILNLFLILSNKQKIKYN